MKHYLVEFVYIEYTPSGEEYQHTLSEVFKLESARDINGLKVMLELRFIANKYHLNKHNIGLFDMVQTELSMLVKNRKISHSEFKLYQNENCKFSHIKNVTLIETADDIENKDFSSNCSMYEKPSNQ